MAKTNPSKAPAAAQPTADVVDDSIDPTDLEESQDALTAAAEENAALKNRIAELEAGAKGKKGVAKAKLEPGTVIDEDDTHETVVVRRPKAGRPTGNYVANHGYRTTPDVAVLIEDGEEKDFDGMMMPGKTYKILNQKVVDHALHHGAIREEVL